MKKYIVLILICFSLFSSEMNEKKISLLEEVPVEIFEIIYNQLPDTSFSRMMRINTKLYEQSKNCLEKKLRRVFKNSLFLKTRLRYHLNEGNSITQSENTIINAVLKKMVFNRNTSILIGNSTLYKKCIKYFRADDFDEDNLKNSFLLKLQDYSGLFNQNLSFEQYDGSSVVIIQSNNEIIIDIAEQISSKILKQLEDFIMQSNKKVALVFGKKYPFQNLSQFLSNEFKSILQSVKINYIDLSLCKDVKCITNVDPSLFDAKKTVIKVSKKVMGQFFQHLFSRALIESEPELANSEVKNEIPSKEVLSSFFNLLIDLEGFEYNSYLCGFIKDAMYPFIKKYPMARSSNIKNFVEYLNNNDTFSFYNILETFLRNAIQAKNCELVMLGRCDSTSFCKSFIKTVNTKFLFPYLKELQSKEASFLERAKEEGLSFFLEDIEEKHKKYVEKCGGLDLEGKLIEYIEKNCFESEK